MLPWPRRLLPLVAACPLAGCTWLVSFVDVPPDSCDGGVCGDATFQPDTVHDGRPADVGFEGEVGACAGLSDGAVCGLDDPCHDAPTCVQGVCVPHPKANNTPCAAALDACHSVPVCTNGICGASTQLPDGYNWMPGDDTARCCGGSPIHTTSNTNCGACTVTCNTAKGQSCGALAGHYLCLNCAGVNTDCWTGCCSNSLSVWHCAPSDCATGACAVPNICPDGSHCQSDVVNYCSY